MSERRLVLVVDDDEAVREFVDWALTEEGYESDNLEPKPE